MLTKKCEYYTCLISPQMNAKQQREQILRDLRNSTPDKQVSPETRERMQKFIQEYPTDEVIIERLSQLEERP